MANFYKDDNGQSLVDYTGLRAVYATSGIKAATTGASVTELDISALNVAANRNSNNQLIVRIVAITNACYVSFGPAATAPSDNTTMLLVPANWEVVVSIRSTDVSMYHQQITGAATVQVSVRV